MLQFEMLYLPGETNDLFPSHSQQGIKIAGNESMPLQPAKQFFGEWFLCLATPVFGLFSAFESDFLITFLELAASPAIHPMEAVDPLPLRV